jgi:choice-of-anchor B domain-containing protein
MKKLLHLFCFAILPLGFCLGQASQATMLDNWHDDSLVPTSAYNNRYNECWGFAINGHEYGVIGSTAGMHIIDVTDPTDVFEAFRVAGASSGANLIHRDMKDYNGYLYCVADEGPSKLQIIDLHDLPNSVTQVYSSDEFVVRSHNLYIDTSQQRLYLLGASSSTKVLDISNPTQPVLLASYPSPNFYMPYTHDGFIKDNIGFFNCGNSGFWIIDFTDPLAPALLGTMTNYTDAGYNHSGWMSEDGNYYFLCDETHGARVKVVDITDLTEPVVVATIEPGLWASEIPHNCLVKGNFLYFSYYYDGLEVWDISDPENPERAYFYDSYPAPNVASYAGAWGVNPNLPSGNILLSDMQGGLFIFESIDGNFVNTSFTTSDDEFDICTGETISFDLSLGSDWSPSGVTLSVVPGNVVGNVQFSQNPAMPSSIVQVTITNLVTTDGIAESLVLQANDGTTEKTTEILIAVSALPAATNQTAPAENASGMALQTYFAWSAVPGADSYKLQVADDLAAFDANILHSANTAATSFTLSNNLTPSTTYYWRVTSKNDCGSTASAIRTFTTEGVNATGSLAGNALTIYPNPASEQIIVQSLAPMTEAAIVSLASPMGQQVLVRQLAAGAMGLSLPVGELPAGIYTLKIASGEAVLVRKVVVE